MVSCWRWLIDGPAYALEKSNVAAAKAGAVDLIVAVNSRVIFSSLFGLMMRLN